MNSDSAYNLKLSIRSLLVATDFIYILPPYVAHEIASYIFPVVWVHPVCYNRRNSRSVRSYNKALLYPLECIDYIELILFHFLLDTSFIFRHNIKFWIESKASRSAGTIA